MKRTYARNSVLALCAAMTLGFLTACGGNAPSAPAQTQTQAAASTETKAAETTQAADTFETDVASWKPDQNTITIRVSNAAGGAADLIYRLVAKSLQDQTGTTAVVQNITGSNGFLMATDLMSYEPSPCEMMLGTEALFVVAPLFNEGMNVSMDDFEFLYGSPVTAPSTLAVPASYGIKTWDEFVEYAKNNRIVVASSVPGGMTHIQASALMGSAGIPFDSVTDSGANKNVLACLNGDATCVVANTSVLKDYVASGQMVPLVQFGKTTYDDPVWGLEPIPSVVDIGFDKIAIEPCTTLCVRKDSDPVGTEAMRRMVTGYLESDEGKADLAEIGISQTLISGEEAKKRLESEIEVMKYIRDNFYK